MGYLDKEGLAYLWGKIANSLSGKQDRIPDDIALIPKTWSQYHSLSFEERKNAGVAYIVTNEETQSGSIYYKNIRISSGVDFFSDIVSGSINIVDDAYDLLSAATFRTANEFNLDGSTILEEVAVVATDSLRLHIYTDSSQETVEELLLHGILEIHARFVYLNAVSEDDIGYVAPDYFEFYIYQMDGVKYVISTKDDEFRMGLFRSYTRVEPSLSGGTMSGPLITQPPEEAGHAANKGYVDGLIGDIGAVLDRINGEVV